MDQEVSEEGQIKTYKVPVNVRRGIVIVALLIIIGELIAYRQFGVTTTHSMIVDRFLITIFWISVFAIPTAALLD